MVDKRNVPKSELVDIRDVYVDSTKTTEAKVRSFIEQIKDPYNFRVGNVVVHVSYTENGRSINDSFSDMLSSI